jgi:hypothetical protein
MKIADVAGSVCASTYSFAKKVWTSTYSWFGSFVSVGLVVTKWATYEFLRAVATYVLIMRVMKMYPPSCEPL